MAPAAASSGAEAVRWAECLVLGSVHGCCRTANSQPACKPTCELGPAARPRYCLPDGPTQSQPCHRYMLLAGLFEDEEEEEDGEAAAQPKKRAPKKGGKGGKQQQKKGGKKPARQRKAVQSDESDWEAELSAGSGSEEESGDEAGSEGSDEAVVAATRAGSRAGRASAGAAAAAKAAALAAAELPFRRRLKKFARAAAAAEAAARSPAGSSGSYPKQQQQQRPVAKATQSVASSTPASGMPLIPKRSSAVAEKQRDPSLLLKRRSEIDRRLEAMVNTAGRLR